MSDYPHIGKAAKQIIDRPIEERVAWLREERWIGYPRAQEVLQRLEDLLAEPRKARMRNMFIVSRTNNGKTAIATTFAARHPVDLNIEGESLIAKVLLVQTPPSPSEADLYSAILNHLYERVPPASTGDKRNRVMSVLKKIQNKILILDELHNFLAGSSLKQQAFLNAIKYITNECKISIVGIGTADLLNAVNMDEQLQNRFIPEIIPKWTLTKDYRRLLMSFESTLPLKEPSNLSERDTARTILALSEGTIGETSALLNAAAEYALMSGQERVDIETIRKANYMSPSDRGNLAKMV